MAGLLSIHGTLALAALLGLPGPHAGETPPAVFETEFVSSTLRRVEHFVISTGDGSRTEDVVGLVEWREREVEGGLVLERDVFFVESEVTVRHVERLTEDTTRLVWREAAPGVGRSQIAEPEGDHLVIVDWLRSGLERTDLDMVPRTQFPLALLESLREGRRLPRRVPRYWPLTRSVEDIQIETRLMDGAVGAARRLVEFLRDDGSLAGRFLFDGEVLEAFQWQSGGPWARRISEDRHRVLRARLASARMIEAAAQPR